MKTKLIYLVLIILTGISYPQALKTFHGAQLHLTQTNPANLDTNLAYRILDSLKAAGITFIRDECWWNNVETVKGIYSFSPAVDSFVVRAKRMGIDMLMILNYNNVLYCDNPDQGTGPITDSNRIAFANYCKAMVAHFSPLGVKHYEIWNEPNIPIFWKPTPNPQHYVQLLQAAYPAIKQIDSNVTVLGCATSPAEGNPSPFIMWRTFIQQVWSYGGGNYMDAVSFHQYRVDKTPENYLIADIQSLQSIIGASKPIYISEIGYHTASVWPNLSLTKQAYYVGKLYIVGRSVSQLKSLLYYDFRNDGENQAEPEHNYGLVYNNLTPKPAYKAYKTVTSHLADKNYINHTITSTFYKYTFSNSNETVNVFFSSSTATQLKTELFNKNALKLQTLLGDPYYIYDYDKIIEVNYTEEPLFVTSLNSLPNLVKLELSPAIDTLIVGQKVKFSVIGKTENDHNVYIDNLNVNWSFSNQNAKIDSTGTLTGLNIGKGILTATFGGIQTQVEINIIVLEKYYEFEKFNDMNRFVPSFNNMLPETYLSIIDTNFTSPDKSLLINYAFKYEAIDRHRVIFDCDYPLWGEPDTILIDIFNNNNGHVVEFQIADRDNEIFKVNTSQIPAKYGWLTAKARLTAFGSKFDYPCRLKRIVFYCVKTGAIKDSIYTGSILLDNLRIHNPIVTNVKDEFHKSEPRFFLSQNYPNPFNSETTIEYEINPANKKELVILKIYDVLGREIETLVSDIQGPGKYSYKWNAGKYCSGIYYYKLQAGNNYSVKKLLYLK